MNRAILSVGHAVFALVLIALGVQGIAQGEFTTIWQGVPKGVPARDVLVYLCAFIALACGAGLLWRATAALAARVMVIAQVIWFLLWRIRALFTASLVESTWSCGETLAILAAAWVLYAACATDFDRRRFAFATGARGLRIARVLYALALLPFGYAHFAYLQHTADMVPHWLPGSVFWAYFTGAAFLAAALAILTGVLARLAAALSALEMGLFGLLVWMPVVAAGHLSAFQQAEVWTTLALTAAGWVVADSYRRS